MRAAPATVERAALGPQLGYRCYPVRHRLTAPIRFGPRRRSIAGGCKLTSPYGVA
jgi:hypothetical protein